MKRSEHGFSLIELIVVIAILGILAAIATPSMIEMTRNARYREAARNIASILREARATAIARNQPCQVVFDVDGGSYSTTGALVKGSQSLGGDIVLLSGSGPDCVGNADITINFNPNGTADSNFVCIMKNGTPLVRKFRVGVASATTGRVVIQRWNVDVDPDRWD